MGAALGWFGRLFIKSLSGLGFFSLFGVTDKDNNNTPLYIALASVLALLGYVVIKKK